MPINVLNVVRHPIGGIRNYLRYTYSQFDPTVYRTTILTVDRPEAKLLPEGMAPLPVELVTVPPAKAFYGLWSALRRLRRSASFDIVQAAPSTWGYVESINNRILTGDLYKALKEARNLVHYEQELLQNA